MINDKKNIAIMAGLAALTVVLGIPALKLPPGMWQGNYLYNGWALTQGLVPYRHIWEIGAPGSFFIYAFALKVFGHSYKSVLILELLFKCITAIVIFLLGKKYNGTKEAIFSSLFYILAATICSKIYMTAAMPISFAILPLALSLYFYKSEKISGSVMAGIFMGLAILTTMTSVVLLLYAIIYTLKTPRVTWEPRPIRSKLFSFLYGCVLPISMAILYLLLSGALDDFVVGTFVYPVVLMGILFYALKSFLPIILVISFILYISARKSYRSYFVVVLFLIGVFILAYSFTNKWSMDGSGGWTERINNEVTAAKLIDENTKNGAIINQLDMSSHLLFSAERISPAANVLTPIFLEPNNRYYSWIQDRYKNNWKEIYQQTSGVFVFIWVDQIKGRENDYLKPTSCANGDQRELTAIFPDGSVLLKICRPQY